MVKRISESFYHKQQHSQNLNFSYFIWTICRQRKKQLDFKKIQWKKFLKMNKEGTTCKQFMVKIILDMTLNTFFSLEKKTYPLIAR